MKKHYALSLLVILALLVTLSCQKSPTDSEKTADEDITVTLNGRVLNTQTGNPLENAVVLLTGTDEEQSTATDGDGKYSFEFTVETSRNVAVIAYKESYVSDTTEVLAVPGRTVDVPSMSLTPTSETPRPTGNAASIVLVSQSTEAIGVRESGSVETAKLVFEVQDSSGVPIDLDRAVDVHFKLGSSPDGGEYLSPPVVRTSNNGQATVNLLAGTIAGTVQIVAEVFENDATVRSKPVAVSIHGGLPDSVHFSTAVEKLNMPGYVHYGLSDGITAYVGDKYANPVRPETAVYFTSDGGIIEGSALTDEQGQASVNLFTAAPMPEHPVYGPGFATVTAQTANENHVKIETTSLVLFSGYPMMDVTPTSVNIPNGGAQSFVYTLNDQNGNPLAEGTSISVSVDGESVKATGDVNVNLPDTQSRGWTVFSFTVFDTADTVDVAKPVTIKISTSGPNGATKLSLAGIGH